MNAKSKCSKRPKLDGLSLEDLRWCRDIASREGNLKLALACAIKIDKLLGRY